MSTTTIRPIPNSQQPHTPTDPLQREFHEFKNELSGFINEHSSKDYHLLLNSMEIMERLIDKQAIENDAHREIHNIAFYARSQLRGLSHMAMQIDGELEGLTGWQLGRMLTAIEDQVTEIMKLDGGNVNG